MTQATLDYLIGIAIAHREALAHQMIRSGEENCPAWGEAAAAVKELLEMDVKGGDARRGDKRWQD